MTVDHEKHGRVHDARSPGSGYCVMHFEHSNTWMAARRVRNGEILYLQIDSISGACGWYDKFGMLQADRYRSERDAWAACEYHRRIEADGEGRVVEPGGVPNRAPRPFRSWVGEMLARLRFAM